VVDNGATLCASRRGADPGRLVRFLAACPLTQSLAFTDAQLQALSRV
jgi:hypothetical protein